MIIFRKILLNLLMILAVNQVLILSELSLPLSVNVLFVLFLTIFYLFYNLNPLTNKQPSDKLMKLSACYDILFSASLIFLLQTVLFVGLITVYHVHLAIFIINLIIALLAAYFLVINALVRSFAVSRQIPLIFRILLLSFWWLPLVNSIFALFAAYQVRNELIFNRDKFLLNQSRKQKEICQTKYPLVMVHGIFFRDWEIFNYWGRIPDELKLNGAKVFYGEHESSLPVEASAAQLKEKILEILNKTGAEKVNIIAHSKGEIDSRYAISCLGLSPYVASLTTINSPHYGSDLAGKMLSMTPKKIVTNIGKQYSKLFTQLGDSNCDFVGAINELTPERCRELNVKMPDVTSIYYQSVGSSMSSRHSAPFPLSLGYSIIRPIGGNNDGLVATKSMSWGNFIGIVEPKGKLGISHGDMIDLTRKNIKGFDVTEFYVKLVADLKIKGL